jgi:cobalt-zinc-cadmium resistance protein CzcA
VLHNLLEGIGLVTVVLYLFLGNVRAALIVAVTIPVALLVAFVFMDGAGIPANLLSIGAVDFGMIVDGSIVVVENVFRVVAEKQEKGESYDLRDLVRASCKEVARPVVFAVALIVTAYLPIFTLERVEGKRWPSLSGARCFRPSPSCRCSPPTSSRASSASSRTRC